MVAPLMGTGNEEAFLLVDNAVGLTEQAKAMIIPQNEAVEKIRSFTLRGSSREKGPREGGEASQGKHGQWNF